MDTQLMRAPGQWFQLEQRVFGKTLLNSVARLRRASRLVRRARRANAARASGRCRWVRQSSPEFFSTTPLTKREIKLLDPAFAKMF
jgi:hypothetical protein